MTLPFNLEIIKQIAEFREGQPVLTSIAKFFTFLGDAEGFILIASLLYWCINKKKAYKITMVAVGALILTDFIKEIIQNPRPFISTGEQGIYWGIDPDSVVGYSTPSGHALIPAAFWIYLSLKYPKTWVKLLSFTMILLIGISRPFLGVHYLEDTLLGWTIGILFAHFIFRYEFKIIQFTEQFDWQQKIILTLLLSLFIWVIPGLLTNFSLNTTEFATAAGMLNGIIIGRMIETRLIKFDSKATNVMNGVLRYLIGIILIFIVLFGLRAAFGMITDELNFLSFLLRYIRYTLVALTGFALVPYLFTKIKLAVQSSDV
jgi:membrane-associated phospholipid phosphatase